MEKGLDFLKSQVNNAVAQHGALVDALKTHEEQADDPRYRDLCSRYIPQMQEHQRMLEDYQQRLGAGQGVAKKAMSAVASTARDLADAARDSDFLRLVNDIVMARQSEDTFRTFREAGKMLGNEELQRLGEVGERGHDDYARDANQLVQTLFVELARGGAPAEGRAAAGVETRSRRSETRPEL
ncbi:MAG TPA: hypothetical protein VFK13_03485 [Gemmatimonadaceae bacterium]|nr:hypothetical protein [Gemmatimonadaceae bacterium]